MECANRFLHSFQADASVLIWVIYCDACVIHVDGEIIQHNTMTWGTENRKEERDEPIHSENPLCAA